MFRQQSSPWKEIATIYTDRVSSAVHAFNKDIFAQIIPDDDLRQKLKARLSRQEQETRTRGSEQLSQILNDERGGILQTVNHYYADTLSAIREERVLARLRAMGFQDGSSFDTARVMQGVHLSNEDQAVNDIHDILKAYYKVAMERFTDNVVLQVTERHILGPAGPVRMLSPDLIGDLQESELTEIAGESFATSSIRNELVAKCERFQRALDIAKQAVI
jgi:hypothetical protein